MFGGLALIGAYAAWSSASIVWGLVGYAALLTGGVVVGAYLVPAWVAWLRHLLREDAQRIAEIASTTPALLQVRAETELTERRIELVREIADLPAEALTYAIRLIETHGAIIDGAVLKWRLGGAEYPAAWALQWWNAYQMTGDIPRDSEWSPEYAMPREDWRRLASAMAAHLSRYGVAEVVGGPIGPRWHTSASQERRAEALRASGVIMAAGLFAASVDE